MNYYYYYCYYHRYYYYPVFTETQFDLVLKQKLFQNQSRRYIYTLGGTSER